MLKKIGGILLSSILILMSFVSSLGGYPLLQDTEPPIVREVNITPNPQIMDGYVNITAAVIDNVQVNVVKVVITYPDSSMYNVTMGYLPVSPQSYPWPGYYYNVTYSLLGMYHFYIWANDTSGNQNQSVTYTFEIIEEDLLPPVISGLQDNPDPQIIGGTVNITCTVTDNVQVDSVHVIIRYPSYHIYNYTMAQVIATDNYYFSTSYPQIGTYYYYIWATDTWGNTATTNIHTFIITQEPGPVIHVEKKVREDCNWVDSATVYVGDTIDFQITVCNTGLVTLTSVRVTDTLPSFLKYNYDAIPVPSYESDHQIEWSLGSLYVGESRVITYSALVVDSGCGHNVALGCSCVGAEDSDSVFITAHDPLIGILSVQKQVQDGCEWVDNITASVGDLLDFKITIQNDGSSALTSVHLTDRLPSFLKYNYDAIPVPSYESDHQIEWSLGSLYVGESRVITYSALVVDSGCGYNRAIACSGEGINDTDNVLLTCTMDGDDTTPPLVHIDKPSRYLYIADRAIMPTLRRPIILGGITLEAVAMDDESGINRVEFLIDNDIKNISHGWPYEWSWNENSFGFYTIKARAYDNAGNSDIDSMDVYIINF